MSKRIFTLADQIAFAELSGDNNPLHVDPVVARRTLFGQPVVHGVHSLLWTLDQWMTSRSEPVRFAQLHAVFLKPVGLDQDVQFNLVSEQKNRVRIDLLKQDQIAVRLMFEWSAVSSSTVVEISPALPVQQPPDLLDQDTIRSCSGFLNLHLQPELARKLFPNLIRSFCPVQFAVLLGMTRLVGVKCPGLNSIFSELKLAAASPDEVKKIQYAVSEFDARYGLTLLAVAAPGLSGSIKAFLRPPPQNQTSFKNLKRLVGEGEFAGQRALVVGGSRGLGEVAAKLLAAGGAMVQLTYRVGKTDAQKVVDEILTGGGHASMSELDVLHPQGDRAGMTAPTHLYYFATPFISGSEKNFSPALYQTFHSYFIDGFAGVVESFQKAGLKNVFYPSTVFIDENPGNFAEYIQAKSTGEALCQTLAQKNPGMIFYCPRLPKMATDQTASLQPVPAPDSAPIILDALQKFRDSIR